MEYKNLFKPLESKNLKLRNRVVFAPVGIGAYNDDETVNETYFPFITERAKGTALIITQGTRPSIRFGGIKLIGTYDDRFIPNLAKFADAAHKNGAKIFIQSVMVGGNDPLGGYAPSVIDIPLYRDRWGRGDLAKLKEFETSQIKELIEDFAQGARRAKEAGFDGVEVHGAYGYLISEFISSSTNRRTDEYGGSFENRMKFPVEIIRRIKSVCGEDFPVGFKFNAHQEIEPENIDEEMGVRIAKRIAAEGVSYLHEVSMGEDVMYMAMAKYPSMPTMYQPSNTTVSLAENLKAHIKDVPIICAGGIINPADADKIIGEGKADMVAVGRALLADPHWTYKAETGKRITPCIKCLVCHHEVVKLGNLAACTVNPYLCKEPEPPLVNTEDPKNVLVIGGGPAGIITAITAARRGHKVTLYEKDKQLGGQLNASAILDFKYEFDNLLDYYIQEINDSSVEVILGTEVSEKLVNDISPDVLVIAIGGEPIVPGIPGIENENAVSAIDCLRKNINISGKKVIVIGGGVIGCEIALWLRRQGKDVIIIEKLDELMKQEEAKYHTMILERMLKEEDVKFYTSSEVIKIMDDSIEIKDSKGDLFNLPHEGIIYGIGLKPDSNRIDKLKGLCSESYIIGDASKPNKIREAVLDGDRTGRSI